MTRIASREELTLGLLDARSRTLALSSDLSDGQLQVPPLPIVNPILWELGHVAWFQEFWTKRRQGASPSSMDSADSLYDSARVEHSTRWSIPLPRRAATRRFLESTLGQVLGRLQQVVIDEEESYFHRLVTFHEDMHGEALAYTRQTLGYAAPPFPSRMRPQLRDGADVLMAGGRYLLGSGLDEPFVFDNEKWAHTIELPGYSIAREPVSNFQFAKFVEAGGYQEETLWSEEGWRWRSRTGAQKPCYWSKSPARDWQVRSWDREIPLEECAPVEHVNAFEAEAYCRWAGRRLPTEAEWEAAAVEGVFVPGEVWEWTSSRFLPFESFSPDPYREYSEPWFATDHRVLRGYSWATAPRLRRAKFRNFYEPHRTDIFAGFRTCATGS